MNLSVGNLALVMPLESLYYFFLTVYVARSIFGNHDPLVRILPPEPLSFESNESYH